MKERTEDSYNGKITEDVKYYDLYAFNHYNKIARELLENINIKDKYILDLGCLKGSYP